MSEITQTLRVLSQISVVIITAVPSDRSSRDQTHEDIKESITDIECGYRRLRTEGTVGDDGWSWKGIWIWSGSHTHPSPPVRQWLISERGPLTGEPSASGQESLLGYSQVLCVVAGRLWRSFLHSGICTLYFNQSVSQQWKLTLYLSNHPWPFTVGVIHTKRTSVFANANANKMSWCEFSWLYFIYIN